MRCPKCGYENREGLRFCEHCGAPLGTGTARHGRRTSASQTQQSSNETAQKRHTPIESAEARHVQSSSAQQHAAPGASRTESPRTQTRNASSSQKVPTPTPVLDELSRKERAKKHLRRTIINIIIAVALAAVGIGAFLYFEHQRVEESLATTHPITISIETSSTGTICSRIPVHVTGYDVGNNAVDSIVYIDADGQGLNLSSGTYDITVLASPLTSEGVLYSVENGSIHLEISVRSRADAPVDANADSPVELNVLSSEDIQINDVTNACFYAQQDPQADEQTQKAAERITAVFARVVQDRQYDQAMDAYEDVLSAYRSFASSPRNASSSYIPDGASDLLAAYNDTDPKFSYSYYDIAGDGVPELIISWSRPEKDGSSSSSSTSSENSNSTETSNNDNSDSSTTTSTSTDVIFAIYGVDDDGNAVNLFPDDEVNENTTLNICEDGYIRRSVNADSEDGSVTFYRLAPSSYEPTVVSKLAWSNGTITQTDENGDEQNSNYTDSTLSSTVSEFTAQHNIVSGYTRSDLT